MLVHLLHFLTGYVLFTASGGFTERFVNLCAGMHIPVWDMHPQDGTLTGKTKPGAYLRLRTAARRAGMRLRLLDKRGIPFLLQRHHRHIGLLAGAAVFVLVLALLSSRIWVIEIEGADTLTDNTIRAALQTIQVREGIRPKALDASYAEREMLRLLPRLHWIALNADGSVLHVKVRENEGLESKSTLPPCHIVARRDGFLEKLETYDGQQMVTPPTAVQHGQLLISGVKEHMNGDTLHHASGYTEAQTTQRIFVQLESRSYPAAKRKRISAALHLFGMTLPLGSPRPIEGAQYFAYARYFVASGKRMPLSCTVYRNTFYAGAHRLTAAQADLLLRSDFGQKAALSLRGTEILRSEIRTSKNSLEGTFTLRENIAAEKQIILGNES